MGSQGFNSQRNGQILGITEPISLGGASGYDVIKTNELEKFLADAGLYESHNEAIIREEVLGRLDQIVKSWVKKVSRRRCFSEQLVQAANAKIFTFGSYRLGVHGPGADIDTLCVGPSHASRDEDFFGVLKEMLLETPDVTELHPVPYAHVPVMKFKLNGASIDLLYAKISRAVIPEDLDISQDSILENIDEQSVRSLNGCRVTDQILHLVPNIQNFRTTLRCMRFWAKQRGVYSNAMELNNGSWLELFEPYHFFEAYRNYLQIDIAAKNDDDMRNWKGWVESRLRRLTLKIERHTFKMLQCHPHPRDFSDRSNPLHCSYFLGLQRKEGVPVNEAKKFDIRFIVNEFKEEVRSYSSWMHGMEINIMHIRRRDIPAFVFPGGIQPSRHLRISGERRRVPETNTTSSVDAGSSLDGDGVDRSDDTRKRKQEDGEMQTKLTAIKLVINEGPSNKGFSVGGPLTSREAEKLAIEKLVSGPYESHQTSPQELQSNLIILIKIKI